MKNNQKGFVIPLLIAIVVAILAIGGGVYVYENKKVEAPVSPANIESQTTNQIQLSNTENQLNTNPASKKLSITLLTPNGGETYKKGDSPLIRWGVQNIGTDTLEIDLLNAEGVLVYNLSSHVNSSRGSQIDSTGPAYSWFIPTNGAPGGMKINPGKYKVRISLSDDSSISDASDGYFTVVEK